MNTFRTSLSLLTFAFAALALIGCTKTKESDVKSLFNGKDLTGWEGLKEFWSVRDGAITGQTTTENPLKANTFLVYKDTQPANFELHVSFKLTPNNERNQANSGVQYRSKVIDPATFVVGGYQADIDSTGRYAGMLYEEKGRGILLGGVPGVEPGHVKLSIAQCAKLLLAVLEFHVLHRLAGDLRQVLAE